MGSVRDYASHLTDLDAADPLHAGLFSAFAVHLETILALKNI